MPISLRLLYRLLGEAGAAVGMHYLNDRAEAVAAAVGEAGGEAARTFAGPGVIVNISSTAGQRGETFHSHYAASKGGIHALTKPLAEELGPWPALVMKAPAASAHLTASAAVLGPRTLRRTVHWRVPSSDGVADRLTSPSLASNGARRSGLRDRPSG